MGKVSVLYSHQEEAFPCLEEVNIYEDAFYQSKKHQASLRNSSCWEMLRSSCRTRLVVFDNRVAHLPVLARVLREWRQRGLRFELGYCTR